MYRLFIKVQEHPLPTAVSVLGLLYEQVAKQRSGLRISLTWNGKFCSMSKKMERLQKNYRKMTEKREIIRLVSNHVDVLWYFLKKGVEQCNSLWYDGSRNLQDITIGEHDGKGNVGTY